MTPGQLIPDLAAALSIDPRSLSFVQRSQNTVFEFPDAQGIRRIVRATADSHRSRKEIQSELDWLTFLSGSGLSACPPVIFRNGEAVHSFGSGGGHFHAVVFEKAAGRRLDRTDLTPQLYSLHGRQLGLLHALSRRSPPGALGGRKRWDAERYFTTDIPAYLPREIRGEVLDRFQSIRAQLESHPSGPEHRGPVHLDLGYSNIFIDRDRLTLFDFDNCTVGPYAYDIAAALYGSIFHWLRKESSADRSPFEHPRSGQILEQIWPSFRDGYLMASPWPSVWNEELMLWFQVMYLRAVVHTFRMLHPVVEPGTRAALDSDIGNILSDRKPVNFDFATGRALL